MKQNPSNGSVMVKLKTAYGEKEFPRLRPSDMIRLKNRIYEELRNKVIVNAEKAKISPDRLNQQLNELDSRPIDRSEIVDWALIPEGIVVAIGMAYLRVMEGKRTITNEVEFEEELKRSIAVVDEWDAEWGDLVDAAAGVLNVQLQRSVKTPVVPPVPPTDGAKNPTLPVVNSDDEQKDLGIETTSKIPEDALSPTT